MYSTEEQIINGCLKRKRKAQKVLFERYHASLMGICMRYSKSKAEAEDILLMGFTQIFKKISTYTGKGSFEGWMRRIIINMAIDNFRKNTRHYFHESIEESTLDPEYATYIPDNFTMEEILKTIQSLPNGYRIVFNLFAIEGYSHKEIAEKLGITESTSKTQYLKARKKLQAKLSGLYNQTVEVKINEKRAGFNLIKPLLKLDGSQ